MAEFIVGNSLRNIARKHEILRQALWRLDFALVWVIVSMSKMLPIDLGSRFGQRAGGWIGPRLKKKTAIYRDNMAIAFPELNDEELDQLVSIAVNVTDDVKFH